MEDFYPRPEIFAQQFGYFKELTDEQKTIENSTTGSSFRSTPMHRAQQQNEIRINDNCSWWHIVEELADKFGYKKLSLDEFDEVETRYDRKNPNARVFKKLPVEIMEEQ
jgi:hypothetical protein